MKVLNRILEILLGVVVAVMLLAGVYPVCVKQSQQVYRRAFAVSSDLDDYVGGALCLWKGQSSVHQSDNPVVQ